MLCGIKKQKKRVLVLGSVTGGDAKAPVTVSNIVVDKVGGVVVLKPLQVFELPNSLPLV